MKSERQKDLYMDLVRAFPLRPLRSEKQLEEAVIVMKKLAMRRKNLTPGESDYLSVLGNLISEYEQRLPRLTSQMTAPEVLAYLLEVNNLQQSDLVEHVGYKSNLSAFMNGHRGLSKRAAVRLSEFFKVSPALFLPKTDDED